MGVARFWEALAQGECGIKPLETLRTEGLKITTGAEYSDYEGSRHLDSDNLLLGDRAAQFAVLAAREAVRDSGWERVPAATGIVTGCCVGGKQAEDASYWEVYGEGKTRIHPLTIPRVMANSGASLIAMDQKINGPTFTVSTACSSSNHAIGQALWMIRQGTVDVALAGGNESPFVFGLIKAWEAMRVVSPDVCRPFSVERKGMSLGEGAGMLVLEEREAAIARGARIYAEVAGFGMSADAHHITQPHPEGAAAAMRMAIRDAEAPIESIGYINAHGTGTLANDPSEASAIQMVFGPLARRVAVSSTKSMHGHALGAAGALEAIATALALHHGLLPPTIHYLGGDPACDLDVVANRARRSEVSTALSNSFAFGGLNAVLVLKNSHLA